MLLMTVLEKPIHEQLSSGSRGKRVRSDHKLCCLFLHWPSQARWADMNSDSVTVL